MMTAITGSEMMQVIVPPPLVALSTAAERESSVPLPAISRTPQKVLKLPVFASSCQNE